MFEMLFTITFFIGFIILLRCICKNHISARLQYAIWILVAVKLLIFPMPDIEGYFSVLGLVAGEDGGIFSEEEISGEALDKAQANGMAGETGQEATAENGNLWGADGQTGDGAIAGGTDSGTEPEYPGVGESGFSKWERRLQIMRLRLQRYAENVLKVPVWFIAVLGAGSVVCALVMLVYHLRLGIYLRKNRIEAQKEPLKVYSVAGLPTPCLFGRKIYIPARLAEDKELLPYALRHEMYHYAHRDHIWGMLRIACVCLYWYHPLVWLAAYLSRQDCELACDEAVVRGMNGEERKRYGELLLEFVLVKGSPADCFSMTTAMSGNARNLRERLRRITGKRKSRTALGIGVAALGLLGICACVTSGLVSSDKQWQSVRIREQEGSLPLQESYEVEYRLSEDAASYGFYLEQYEYGELVSAQMLDCGTLLPDGKQERKAKRGEAIFSRDVESDEASGAYLRIANSYSMPDYSASDGPSSAFKAFTLELPENCIGNSFSFSSAEKINHRFRMNEDIILLADYYGDSRGLQVPGGHIFDPDEYMEKAGAVMENDRCVILVHLVVSDKKAEELKKQLEEQIKSKSGQASATDISGDRTEPYEETMPTEGEDAYSDEELLEMAENYYRKEHGFAPGHVVIDSEDGNQATIWLYDMDEFLNAENEIAGSANTRDWYTVDRRTGRGENVLFEEVDLAQAGFLSMPWDKALDGMTVTDASEQESFSLLPGTPEAGAESRLYLLGETNSFRLYGAGDYSSMILEEGDVYTEIAVPFIVDGITMQAPGMQEADYDGDGEPELAVKLLWGEGTGIWEEKLWMLDKEAGRIKAYEYHSGEFAAELLRQLAWHEENGRKRILLDGRAISPWLQEEGGISYEEMSINTSQASFAFQDGTIRLRTLISCGSREDSAMPAYGDACLEAEVLYRNGGRFSVPEAESADLKEMKAVAQEAVKAFYQPRQIEFVDYVFHEDMWSCSDEAGERMEMTLTVLEEGTDSYDYATVPLVRDETGRWSAEEIVVEK